MDICGLREFAVGVHQYLQGFDSYLVFDDGNLWFSIFSVLAFLITISATLAVVFSSTILSGNLTSARAMFNTSQGRRNSAFWIIGASAAYRSPVLPINDAKPWSISKLIYVADCGLWVFFHCFSIIIVVSMWLYTFEWIILIMHNSWFILDKLSGLVLLAYCSLANLSNVSSVSPCFPCYNVPIASINAFRHFNILITFCRWRIACLVGL